VVIINDCSTDNSGDIIDLYTSTFQSNNIEYKVLQNTSNKGIAYTRKLLIEHSRGKYVMFIDSDDYIDSHAVESLCNLADETHSDIIVSDFFEEKKNKQHLRRTPFFNSHKEFLRHVVDAKCNALWNKMFKKSFIDDFCLGEMFSTGHDFWEDYAFVTKACLNANKVVKIGRPYYHYVMYNNQSVTKQFFDEKKLDSMVYYLTIISSLVEKCETTLNPIVIQKKFKLKEMCILKCRKENITNYRTIFPELANHGYYIRNHIISSELFIKIIRIIYASKKKFNL